jgi:hypothetical protein
MSTVAGDITEVTCNHPSIGSITFFPKAGEDSTYDLGGIKTADDANMVDGGGGAIWQKSRAMGFFECVITNDMNTREDLEKIAALAEDPVPAQWTFSVINGVVYGGEGMPVGDIQGNINQGTTTLKVAAPQFKKISG